MNSIGMNIKKLRESKRLTQGELAAVAGVDKNTVWRWETNSRRPGPKKLEILASFFGVSIGELLSHEETESTNVDTSTRIENLPSMKAMQRRRYYAQHKGEPREPSLLTLAGQEEVRPIEVSIIAAALDEISKQAKYTDPKRKLLISEMLKDAIRDLEAHEGDGIGEQKSDGEEAAV